MRIGVDGGCWSNGRGYGRFTRELVSAMMERAPDDEFVLFADAHTLEALPTQPSNVRCVQVAQAEPPGRAAAADGYRSPADMLRFTRAVWKERPAVFFSPSVYTYFPLPPRLPCVVAIHDAIPERFPQLTLPGRRARMFWRAKVRLALAQANIVVTVSEYSARELGRALGVPRARIRVVSNAPSPVYRQPSSRAQIAAAAGSVGLQLGARWLTYVGGFNPHKRVDRVVRAHAQLAAALGVAAPHLLLIGTTGGDVFHGNIQEIRETVQACGTSGLVHWTGFVEDERLRHLHAGALALVLVSEAEGFGLPAIEAAACGTPVIATTESPLPEILAGGGVFVRPGDDAALLQAMRLLATDVATRDEMGRRARLAAHALSWEDAADAALEALRAARFEAAPATGAGSVVHGGGRA